MEILRNLKHFISHLKGGIVPSKHRIVPSKHVWIFKTAFFLLLLTLILVPLGRLLMIKGIEQAYFSPVSSYQGFYQMEEDSVDLLYLGSSHAYCGFDPQVMYDNFGIRSYNLGSSQQSLILSEAWLQEALKYQKPRALILEVFYFYYPMGNEASVHKALDSMRWSWNKADAVWKLALRDPQTYHPLGFLVPALYYHDRWKELEDADWDYDGLRDHYELKGYSPILYSYGKDRTDQNRVTGAAAEMEKSQEAKIPEEVKEYFAHIVQLCRDHDMDLILVKTPCADKYWNEDKGRQVRELASAYDLAFYDFNQEDLYEEIGYDFARDSGDSMHANLSGAGKITGYMGNILIEEGSLPSIADDQWEETSYFHRNLVREFKEKNR